METLIPMPFWHLVTRLGEAQILLPAAAVALICLARRAEGRRYALCWTLLMFAAVFITTATKVAFIGWGVGLPELDFTGISGHSMFSAIVFPLLMAAFIVGKTRTERWAGWTVAMAGAAVIAWSRVVVGAHSESEALSGWMLGAGASALAGALADLPSYRTSPLVPVAVAAWLALSPIHAAASRSHDIVTALSLKLSGRATPHVRRELENAFRRDRSHLVPPAPSAEPLSVATARS